MNTQEEKKLSSFPLRIAVYRGYFSGDSQGDSTAGIDLAGILRGSSDSAASLSRQWVVTGEYAEEDAGFHQFDRMLADARCGLFDYIFTDSIRTFGKNMKAALASIEMLTVLPVGVFFQNEGIDTLSEEGKTLLRVFASFDERRSRDKSATIHQGIRQNFESGKPTINLDRMLGFKLSPDGSSWMIVEEQAKTVKYIFNAYEDGKSANQIARELNEAGVKTINDTIWRADTVMGVLRNEKYAGDIEMQKTISLTTYSPVENTGQAPRYYITNHHEAIISRDQWDRVQAMVRGVAVPGGDSGAKKKPSRAVFGRLVCGCCGGSFERHGYSLVLDHYTDERSLAAEGITGEAAAYISEQYAISYSVWRCGNKYKGHGGKHGRLSEEERASCDECPDSHILHEVALEQSFMEMLYRAKREYREKGEESSFAREFREAYRSVYESLGGMGALYLQIDAQEDRIRNLTGQLESARRRLEEVLQGADAAAAQSAAEIYGNRISSLEHGIAACEEEKNRLTEEAQITAAMKKNYDFFVRSLLALPDRNKAGEKLNVNGIDAKGSVFADFSGNVKETLWKQYRNGNPDLDDYLSAAPDLLPFDKGMYLAFFQRGVVRGDTVEYTTNFGVKFQCPGCGRNLNSFLGFRQVSGDGKIGLITENWQVNGRQIQYRRKERKYKKRRDTR